ncbi:hypothetical protein QZM78_03315 [Burkholderia multivorans]|nr:hypothetical protein [Burkholderia multivorans]
MSYLDRSVNIPGPRAMLEREEFCGELLRALADALKLKGCDVLPAMREPRDFNGACKEDLGRRDCATSCAEGFIDISTPLYGCELEGSPKYARVHFRASLTVTVVQGDECRDGRADDGAQQAGS